VSKSQQSIQIPTVAMEKNRKWIEALEQGDDQLDEKMKLSVMKSAGKGKGGAGNKIS
jgi:hypothetical protein